MPSNRLRYEVDVNARDGISELKKLGQAGKDAGQDIEQGMGDAESAGKQAAKALVQAAQDIATELKADKEAADALARALGPEMAAKTDMTAVVTELKSVGLTSDQIKLDADELGLAIKQIDDIKLQSVDGEIKNVGEGLTNVHGNADQSRSVLANMAGNAAQDLGQLGGVVGTLGVGIGQLAEYAVDGNIKLSNLAGVAGPMAGLAAATLAVQYVMEGIAKADAFRKEQVDQYREAVDAVGEGTGAVLEKLQGIGEFQFAADSGILGFGTSISDITGILDKYGITVEELAPVISGTEEQTRAWMAALQESGVHGDDLIKIIAAVGQQQDAYNTSLERGVAAADVFATSAGGITEAMQAHNAELVHTDFLWRQVLDDLKDGHTDTQNAASAWNFLRDQLGLTDAAMAELAQQKLDEQLEADRQAAEELTQALGDAGDAISDIESDIPDIGAALADALDVADAPVDLQVLKSNLTQSFADLQTFIAEHGAVNWAVVLDPTSGTQGFDPALAGMITQVRDQFQEGIVSAFDQGGTDGAQAFVETFLPQLLAQGMTPAQAYQLLGLPPDGHLDAIIDPLVDAEAAARAASILDAITGTGIADPRVAAIQIALATDNIDPEIAEIASLLLAQELGIPVNLGAFAPSDIEAAQTFLDAHPVTVPVDADVTPAENRVEGFRGETEKTVPVVPVDAETSKAEAAANTFVSKPRTAFINADLIEQIVQGMILSAFLDYVGRERTVNYVSRADNLGDIEGLLNTVARSRDTNINVHLPNYWDTERALAELARRRDSYIYVHTVPTGGGSSSSSSGGGASTLAPAVAATGLAAVPTVNGSGGGGGVAVLAAPAPVNQTFHIEVKAAVVGDRNAVRRTVMRAVRDAERLGART